jgi:hypothetical protein
LKVENFSCKFQGIQAPEKMLQGDKVIQNTQSLDPDSHGDKPSSRVKLGAAFKARTFANIVL